MNKIEAEKEHIIEYIDYPETVERSMRRLFRLQEEKRQLEEFLKQRL